MSDVKPDPDKHKGKQPKHPARRRRGGRNQLPSAPELAQMNTAATRMGVDLNHMITSFTGPVAALITEMSAGLAALIKTMVDAAYQKGRTDMLEELRRAERARIRPVSLHQGGSPVDQVFFGGGGLGASAASSPAVMAAIRSQARMEKRIKS